VTLMGRTSATASGVARVLAVHGSTTRRLEGSIAGGVRVGRDGWVVVTTGGAGRPAARHLVDVRRGQVLDSRPLGPTRAAPTALSHDGGLVAFSRRGRCSVRRADGTLRWKRRGGWTIQHFLPHEDSVLAVSPQGSVGELDGGDGGLRWQLPGHGPLVVSRDGTHVAFSTPGRDPALVLHRRGDLQRVGRWPVAARVAAVVPGGADVVCVADTRDGQALCRLQVGGAAPAWVALLPAGTFPRALTLGAAAHEVLLFTTDGVLRRYDLHDGALHDEVAVGPWAAAFDRDGGAALFTRGGRYASWSADGGLAPEPTGHLASVLAVACSPDGSQVASADIDSVYLWAADGTATPLDDVAVHTLQYSGDGAHVLCSHLVGPHHAWSAADGGPGAFPFPVPVVPVGSGWPAMVHGWRSSPDGRLLWVREETRHGRARRLVRCADGVVLWEHTGDGPVVFTGDSAVTTIAGVDGRAPAVCRLRTSGASPTATLVRLDAQPDDLYPSTDDEWAFSEGGHHLAVGGRHGLQLFDARDGRRLASSALRPDLVAFAGDQRLVCVPHGTSDVVVLEAPTLRQVGAIRLGALSDRPTALAISADGRTLAVGTHGGAVLRCTLDDAAGHRSPLPASPEP